MIAYRLRSLIRCEIRDRDKPSAVATSLIVRLVRQQLLQRLCRGDRLVLLNGNLVVPFERRASLFAPVLREVAHRGR